MKLGIVGLPNVGKSTLFNAITDAGAQSANYPFCTIEPNIGVVAVPDKRLDKLAEMYDPDKYTPASIEFVDIAGLVKGASKGEGLGNKFLSNIRECDAIVHVVRCFENDDIIHVEGNINPARDIETINLELILSDVEMLERRIDKTKKMLKGDKKYQKDIDLFERVLAALNEGIPARSVECDDDEKAILSEVALLTNKPVIYAANMSDEDFYIYITSHAYKHYSGSGTGLRTLMDFYAYLNAKGDTFNLDYIWTECKKHRDYMLRRLWRKWRHRNTMQSCRT